MVADLARRHGTSTNPVREALQLLRGEGFVIFVPNRGARVRPIDQDFVRDIYEIGVLIEPALTRWFVNMATGEDIAELERIQGLIEENNFADTFRHSELDTAFHTVMYQRHYNRHAAELWWKHREVLRAVSRRFNFTLARRAAIMREHRELIAHVKAGECRRGGRTRFPPCRGFRPACPRTNARAQRRSGRIDDGPVQNIVQPFQTKVVEMKITSIRPWLIKSDASYWGEFLFVEVTTDEGVSGWGEITTTTKLANRALCTILRQIGVAVTGEDPRVSSISGTRFSAASPTWAAAAPPSNA